MKKYIFILIALLSTLTFAQTSKVTVAGSATLTTSGLYIAIEKGYFKEQNIEIDLQTVHGSGAPLTLLLSEEKIQVAAAALTAGVFNASKPNGFKIVADKGHTSAATDYIGLVVRKDLIDNKSFKSLKDLKGKKIGLTSLDGVSQQIVLARMLESVSLKLSDVETVKMTYPETNIALRSKAIDAAILLDPYIAQGIAEGISVAFDYSNKYVPDQQSAVVMFSKDFIQKNRPVAVRFLKAYLKGIEDYNKSVKDKKVAAEIRPILNKYIKVEPQSLWDSMRYVGLNSTGEISMKGLQFDMDWYYANKFMKTKMKAEDVVDNSLLKEALSMN